jgi:prepilin-type N-terminal cleavage/methylation domain-containing protein
MTKPLTKHRLGLSLVELLVAMAILGILLAMLSAFLISNQRVTSQQITAATLNNDLRLAFLRMTDVVSQAQYIFPPEQTLKINGTDYTTGARTLAVLVPSGTTYCNTADDYCGFAYTIEERASFSGDLGANGGTTNFALVETKEEGLTWAQMEPSTADAVLNGLYTWTTTQRMPIVDSVNAADSDLASFGRLEPSKNTSFDGGFTVAKDITTATEFKRFLAASVNSAVSLERTVNGKALSLRQENFVFSRAIPRGSEQ